MATSSPRRRMLTIAALGGAAGAGLVVAAALGGPSPWEAAGLLAADAILVALAFVVLGVRRVDAKVQKALREQRTHASELRASSQRDLAALITAQTALQEELRDAVRETRGTVGEDRVEFFTHLTGLRDGLADLAARVDALDERAAALAAGVRDAADDTYDRVESHAAVLAWLRPRAPMPALSGWALRPDVLRTVVDVLVERRPGLVVECGSGASSVWLGYALERLGGGRLVALEHDERYLRATRDLIRAHGLDTVVEIRHAPLEPWRQDDEEYPWYSVTSVKDLTGIGAVLVDGPPGATRPHARYPALPLLLPHCADDVVIVLDDALRDDEQELSDRWLTDHPSFGRTTTGHAHVFTGRPR
ncbi:class I SAM-dependent methyltransferase [Actinomadura flavalba]|uniref:class I SAM-dependent methyltransferase n=1 Tax=Actinomadura flavalba TaxID=1120938 RepID=UPI000399FA10|nr:class I SAM-dependent methyltransferase [Actinomadura flavalba]